MPCTTQKNLTPTQRELMALAIKRLEAALSVGVAQAVIGAQGAIAFKGWKDNQGVTDLCAYRALVAKNSPALRRAMARAEVLAGRKVDTVAIATGTHSHDGGRTFSTH